MIGKCWTRAACEITLGAMILRTDDELPDDVATLKALIAHERSTHATAMSAREAEIARLRAQMRLLLAQRFGSKSERVSEDGPQLGLFNEAEAEAEREVEEAASAVTRVAEHTRVRGHRRPLPAELPREEIVHDVTDAAKFCPHDGTPLTMIGAETSKQLDIVPASIRVLQHRRLKYACPCCRQHVVTAPLPAQPIPKSQASIATAKYADVLPWYRVGRHVGLQRNLSGLVQDTDIHLFGM